MSEESLREELRAAFRNRALLYRHFYHAIRDRLGEDEAVSLMQDAIYRRGAEIGERFRGHAPADLAGVCRAFLATIPDGGAMFQPEVRRCDEGGVDIKFHRCPLKEAWQAAGVGEAELATLCAIAGRIDDGTFETAGFSFSAETWTPGDTGCCFLHIRPGKPTD